MIFRLNGERPILAIACPPPHFDNDTVRGDVRVTAQVSPMTSLIFDAAHEEFDKDDSIRTERNSDLARISVAQRLDRITVARVGFGHRRMERFSEVEDTENSGVTATFSLRREHRGGESLLRYTRDINSVGAWQTLSVGAKRSCAMVSSTGRLVSSTRRRARPK